MAGGQGETRRQRLFTLDEARELVLMDSASLSSCSGDTGSTSEDSDSDANSTEPVLTQTKQISQAGGSNNTRHARQRSRDFGCRPRPTRGRGQGSRATRCNIPSLPVPALAAQLGPSQNINWKKMHADERINTPGFRFTGKPRGR